MADSSSPNLPARGYTWPPFEPGNVAALTHGCYSPSKVDPLAAELVESFLADPDLGYLRTASYRPALWSWARAEARVQLLSEYLGDGVGDLDDPRILAAWKLLGEQERAAATGRARLGLDPMSRARLGRDVAATQLDGAALLTRLREAAEKAAQSEQEAPNDHG